MRITDSPLVPRGARVKAPSRAHDDRSRVFGPGVTTRSLGDDLGHPEPVRFTIPIRLVNGANAREHHHARGRRAKEQRGLGRLFAQSHGVPRLAKSSAGLRVLITRVGPRPLDSDNLAISAKHVRDGIADAAGVDDGSAWWTWEYGQRRPRLGETYAVDVEIELRYESETP